MSESPKVLVIEDDRFLSSLLRGRMEKEGFTVKQSFDGEEAYALLKQFQPDVIITDLIMPRLSGFELLEKISIDPQFNRIPVIILSNLGQDSDIQKAKQLGVAEYFIKTKTSVEQVVGAVKNLANVPAPSAS